LKGFDPSILTDPRKVHLSLLMLNLYTEDAKQKAASVFQSCLPKIQEILEGQPLSVRLQGIAAFEPKHEVVEEDTTEFDVLFIKVYPIEGDKRLDRISRYLAKTFHEANLIAKDEFIDLHATIMNSKFRSNELRQPFDASGLLMNYSEYKFAETIKLESLHLSQRFEYDANGYFHCLQSIDLPK